MLVEPNPPGGYRAVSVMNKEMMMMNKDYIPSTDAALADWGQNFLAYAQGHLAELGLVEGDLTELGTKLSAFIDAVAAQGQAHRARLTATQTKNLTRAAAVEGFRELARRVGAAPGVSDTHRAGLGLRPRDGEPSVPRLMELKLPRPILRLDTAQRLQHRLRIASESTPTRRSWPEGVFGCEVWTAIGEAPSDPAGMRLVELATRSSYLAPLPPNAAGAFGTMMGA